MIKQLSHRKLADGLQKWEAEVSQKDMETREAIRRVAQDCLSKLEAVSRDLTTKVSTEASERTRLQESLQQQVDAKTKSLEERLALRIKEAQEHSDQMEAQLQSQFRRFTDSCTGAIQDVHKSAITFAKSTEAKLDDLGARAGSIEADLVARTSQIAGEIKSLRNISAKECAKVGEIIRDEITARFASDMWTKQGTQKLVSNGLQGNQPGVFGGQGTAGDPD